MDQSPDRFTEFARERERLNHLVLERHAHLGTRRFFALDSAAYRDGALDARTKELLGLVASAVLRCDDCITYHVGQCVEAGFSDSELDDALHVALVVGGSIVIPHLRRAVETIEILRKREERGD